MARHFKGQVDVNASSSEPEPAPSHAAANPQHTQVRPASVSDVPEIGVEPAASPSLTENRAEAAGAADTAGSESANHYFDLPEKKPHRKWPIVLLLIVIIAAGVLFVGLFVWPEFFENVPVIGDFVSTQSEQPAADEGAGEQGATGEDGAQNAGVPEHPGAITEPQTATVQASDGATYSLDSDLHSEVRLESVSDDGITLRFMSDTDAAYTTVHVTSVEVNGETLDPFAADTPLQLTLHNEYTGDTTETPDPYFIVSPVDGNQDSTTLTVRVQGLTVADYASLKLGIDQTFAYGEISTGDYDVAEVNGLFVDVTRS